MWDLPEPFSIELRVQPDDIDDYGHVNNAVYLRWLDQVAWAHAEAVGVGRAMHSRMRRGMAAMRTELQYLAPALEDDELLGGNWIVHSDGRLRAQRRYQIVRPSDGATLLRALSLFVCIDIDSGRPSRMPEVYSENYVVLPSVAQSLAVEKWPFSISPNPLTLKQRGSRAPRRR